MTIRLKDRLTQEAASRVIGRETELAALLDALEPEGPAVIHVHGIGGMGKSALLAAFAARARAAGATVITLDGRLIEPTERGFLDALGAASGGAAGSVEAATERLGRLGDRVALVVDTYDVLRLLDTWLRQVFVPALEPHVRVVLASREAPVAAWLASPGWPALSRSMRLEPLAESDADALLRRSGVPASMTRRINHLARGHPLALTLAAAALAGRADLNLDTSIFPGVIEHLTHLYLAEAPDPLTRRALEAAVGVRRVTRSLLGAMLPEAAPLDAYERLRSLPFVESTPEGLHVHDVVREVIAAATRAADPQAYRERRRAAWRQLVTEARMAGRSELWRYTADLLYIFENPLVREAFFPSDAHHYAIEPAHAGDGPAIQAIMSRHLRPEAGRMMLDWWERAPHAFIVARDPAGEVAGCMSSCDTTTVPPSVLRHHRVLGRWLDHIRQAPMPSSQHAMFLLPPISRDDGDAMSAVQAVCWLNCKRTYLELRPHLRRVYSLIRHLALYEPILSELGFRELPHLRETLDGEIWHTVMLDFGPDLIDGWLARLVARELGVAMPGPSLLDVEAREIVLDDRRVGLTPLEFGVLRYLSERPGKAVTRQTLLAEVWGQDYDGGSNVVDAVVRTLRRKLGDQASLVETARGTGYRFRPPDAAD